MDGKRSTDKTAPLERVGAGGEVGAGQQGRPLRRPAEEGDRERVGAGGPVGGQERESNELFSDATKAVVEGELEQGDVSTAADPDQKSELDKESDEQTR